MLEKLSKVEKVYRNQGIKVVLKLIILTSTLDTVMFEAIAVLSKGITIQTTTFGFACIRIVGKLYLWPMLVVLVLLGKVYLASNYSFH